MKTAEAFEAVHWLADLGPLMSPFQYKTIAAPAVTNLFIPFFICESPNLYFILERVL